MGRRRAQGCTAGVEAVAVGWSVQSSATAEASGGRGKGEAAKRSETRRDETRAARLQQASDGTEDWTEQDRQDRTGRTAGSGAV
ncbi:hypothetical protein HBI56_236680 [Parastagonospora nodorum]|uniref:Uncharacterized protein n=1 Tax=Phaeosphaeria nodorum (strain SN15 / ATCC MYA-4574 / FGSC 10173) TaxID=321614 RepID=A0A7U2HZ26_PHANO|nr:hypothetical protein HBH56_244460 [Parastagonospora nodorum]QRC95669.1 hypothetical protein JI435_033250 [Parastagonospora nodorum SN15]KAH3937542.1 hypothetical protein HBH54_011100 [Parastagonospora nodorum]KAH3944200.1 hypothetical protein HBH53_165600 [Parastagonospora nodorum]KAH4011599.1 hypothetical protein HBI13_199530 [Parastagonospora nodorum]